MSQGTLNNEKLRHAIRRLMKARGLTQSDLAYALHVSAATIKRTLNGDDLSVERLSRIAAVLGIDFFELVRIADDFKVSGVQMSEDQEQFLLEFPARAHVLWRLANGFSPAKIAKDAGTSQRVVTKYLKELQAMDLVEDANGTWRATIRWPVGFRFKGPLHQAFTRRMIDGFVDHLYRRIDELALPAGEAPTFSLRIVQFILREKTYQKYREEHAELLEKYLGISRLERATEREEDLRTISVLFGSDTVDIAAEVFGPPA